MKTIQIIISMSFLAISCSWSQDTIRVKFNSKFHLEHDYRQYDSELDQCVVFIYNRFISGLSDGVYYFEDSVSNKIRLFGKVQNSRLVNKWAYFDSLGRKRIEDVFFNDKDSTVHTSYYDEKGYVYRTKEGSRKFLRTIHYSKTGMSDYYFNDFTDSCNIQMGFSENGQLSYRNSTKKELNHGEFFWAYDDGTLYAQHFYENGLKTGIWKSGFKGSHVEWCTEKYENDRLTFISFRNGLSYQINKEEKEIVDHYPNGKIRLKGKVINGIKYGTWNFYDEKGEIIGKFHHDKNGNSTSWSLTSNEIPAI